MLLIKKRGGKSRKEQKFDSVFWCTGPGIGRYYSKAFYCAAAGEMVRHFYITNSSIENYTGCAVGV